MKLSVLNLDKLLHFFVCYSIMLSLCLIVPWYVGAAVTLFWGVGKELCDRHAYGLFCWRDLLADVLGMSVALALWRIVK